MRIGIDISQMAYKGTGVAAFIENLLSEMIEHDTQNEYIFFGSSLRNSTEYKVLGIKYKHNKNIKFKIFPIPPSILDILWNKLHIFPIERFIGNVDVFISSDWTQPPVRNAKNVTILYDLVIFKYPQETASKIIETQKRRLKWVKKECDKIICISEATKSDAIDILGIGETRLEVVYPGIK